MPDFNIDTFLIPYKLIKEHKIPEYSPIWLQISDEANRKWQTLSTDRKRQIAREIIKINKAA